MSPLLVPLRRDRIAAGVYVFSNGIGKPLRFRVTRSFNGSWLLARPSIDDPSQWLTVYGFPTLAAATAAVEQYRGQS